MKKVQIQGGKTLYGKVKIQGSKNAVLPILSGTILADDVCYIRNCPELSDVHNTINILEHLNCKSKLENNVLKVDSTKASYYDVPDCMMRKMRSSILFMGALLNKFGYAKISLPGGCELGARPIDIHLNAFAQFGVEIKEYHGYYQCYAKEIVGNDVCLGFPSVGATENIMLLTCRCNGTAYIHNVAKEPEIIDLQNFLNSMGANISGAGTDTICIKGVKKLYGCNYSVMPDRIVAITYLIASAITKGNIILENANYEDMVSVISVLNHCGYKTINSNGCIEILPCNKCKSVDLIRTMPYPGFPTDAQSIITPMLSLADGTSIICENLFENRFNHVYELNRMGADISVMERNAIIKGVNNLYGTNVTATDLRSSAGLIIAGLCAEGKTIVDGIEYLDRGYDYFIENLNKLGANISYIS